MKYSSLYKFYSCLIAWLLDCLIACPSRFVQICPSRFSAKSTRNFTKLSPDQKFGLLHCLKLFGTLHILACTHNAWKRAPYFCALFWVVSFYFLRHFLTENKKTEATLNKGMDKTEIFHFNNFFRFRYGSPSKWPPNFFFSLFFHFLASGGQNMILSNKSNKIIFFCHILLGHMQLFYFSFWSGSPLNWPKRAQNG